MSGQLPFPAPTNSASSAAKEISVRPTEISLGAHVEQPPRQALAVQVHPVFLAHDETFWTHWKQRSQLSDPAFCIDPIDRDVWQSARGIA